MRTLIFQRIIPHYRLSVFRRLTSLLDAIVCHGKELPGSFPKDEHRKIDFPHCQTKNWYFISNHCTFVTQDVLTPILKYRPRVIVTEFALCILSNWILFLLRPFFGFKLIFWSHGYNRRKGFHPESSWSDRLRIWMINRADGVILYGDRERQTLSKWVKRPEKLFVANNTLDTPSLLAVRDECIGEGVKSIKERWRLNRRYILSYSGRLTKKKRLDLLLKMFKLVQHKIVDCALIIIGDGLERSVLKSMALDLEISNVYFLGEITDNQEIGELLFISDVMVIPGYVGLAVVHAFCFDTPVVTQKQGQMGPFHSPEVTYIKNGKTGFLCENENLEDMAQVVIRLLEDKKLREKMKAYIRRAVIQECSLKQMLEGYKRAVETIAMGKKPVSKR